MFFDQPVQIEPEHNYTASVVLDGSELSYFGQEGLVEVTAAGTTFQFQSSLESTNGTGVQGGQIPELLFYGPAAKEVREEERGPPGEEERGEEGEAGEEQGENKEQEAEAGKENKEKEGCS